MELVDISSITPSQPGQSLKGGIQGRAGGAGWEGDPSQCRTGPKFNSQQYNVGRVGSGLM